MTTDQHSETPTIEQPVVGWTDTIFLPFDIDYSSHKAQLAAIGTAAKVMMCYDPKEGVLRVVGDTEHDLRDCRDRMNTFFNHRHSPKQRKPDKPMLDKARHPGVWGQPREMLAAEGLYKVFGNDA
ncbi:hypothetical protein SpCBS45565_g02151 [Spizellomyces sp. 'palustris']|nr:hypothetical protein SpCBS45565_g02151 [Spizellomyces sp. 'palustris']